MGRGLTRSSGGVDCGWNGRYSAVYWLHGSALLDRQVFSSRIVWAGTTLDAGWARGQRSRNRLFGSEQTLLRISKRIWRLEVHECEGSLDLVSARSVVGGGGVWWTQKSGH